MALKRHDLYVGCKESATEADLDRYEALGQWVADVKADGEWGVCFITPQGQRFESRTALRIEETDSGALELARWQFPEALYGAVFVGEVGLGTQRAVDEYARDGYRKFYVFDLVSLQGKDLRDVPLEDRRRLLEAIWSMLGDEDVKRFRLVEQRRSGFRQMYRDIIAAGGEGIVLKKLGTPYRSMNSDHKVPWWVKCKKVATQDMVVLDFGYGEKTKEITSFVCGMYVKGALKPVCKVSIQGELYEQRRSLQVEDWRGKVVEVEGEMIFRSGAVRHGFVVRVRHDKSPGECVLQ